MSCDKCIAGSICYCSNCGGKAEEYWDDDGGMIFCPMCDTIGEDYSIIRIPCEDCMNDVKVTESLEDRLEREKNYTLQEKIVKLIEAFHGYEEGLGRKYFFVRIDDREHLVTPTDILNSEISVYCYIDNFTFNVPTDSIQEIQFIHGNWWYRHKVSGWMNDIPSVKKFLQTSDLIADPSDLVRFPYWGQSQLVTVSDSEISANAAKENHEFLTFSFEELMNPESYHGNGILKYCHRRKEKRLFFISRIDYLEFLWRF